MKLPLLLIALILSNKLLAQTKECRSIDRNKNLVERYYALQADTQIKEGRYVAYTFFTDRIICKGFYKNNLKDCTWNYYSFTRRLADSGTYYKDKKIGVWYAFKDDGQIQLAYDFTNKKLISYNRNPEDTGYVYKIVTDSGYTMSSLERPPIYLDGDVMLKNTIGINIRYPQQARESNIQGKVIVGFIINTDGHVSDYKIIKPVPGLNEAATEAVKHASGDWLPGLQNGKPVAVEYIIPVTFSLAK
jgi:TonB family protein